MTGTFADSSHVSIPNFIICGEMGVGKSSLVNLIAGANIALASSGAASCTLQSTEYKVKLHDSQCEVNLYDTAGLNEPTMNNANYIDAIARAHELILSLQEKGGVHGLLFCIRGGRLSDTIQRNYKLFHEFLCQEKVPLALVITGLENEQGDMDNWWTQNKAHVERSGIHSVRQACITTIKGYSNVYEKRYVESRKKMHGMLNDLVWGTACPVDVDGWFARICKKLLEFLAPGKAPRVVSKSHVKSQPRATNIVIFGKAGSGKSSVINAIAQCRLAETSSSATGCTSYHQWHEIELSGKSFVLFDTVGLDEGSGGTVPDAEAEEKLKTLLRELTSPRSNGIGLLVYCVGCGKDSGRISSLLRNYNRVYSTICKKKVPIVIVTTGLERYEPNMESWWSANKNKFAECGMKFKDHACVTTLIDNSDVTESERLRIAESWESLRTLIVKNSE